MSGGGGGGGGEEEEGAHSEVEVGGCASDVLKP